MSPMSSVDMESHMSKRKPRHEERQVYCAKCKRLHDGRLLVGVALSATVAALKSLTCPRCKAHGMRWLELVTILIAVWQGQR